MSTLTQPRTFSDAQAGLGFVQAQTTHIETQVYKTRYPGIRYQGLIPIDTSAHPYAQAVDYYSMDEAGEAQWIADRAADIPVVGTEMGKSTTAVHTAGIGYDYGLIEVNQASMLGMPLTADKANAARHQYERMVDKVAFDGDTEKGFEGLYSYTGVDVMSAPTGSWAAATEDEILADINAQLTGVFTATGEVAMADTLLLPATKYQYIASRRLGDTGMTILDFIQKSNAYTAETGLPLTIRGIRGLDTAGASDAARSVAYRRSPEVLKLHIPMPHRFLPVQVVGLTFKVPGIFRLGGLDIRLPKEVRYMDGL